MVVNYSVKLYGSKLQLYSYMVVNYSVKLYGSKLQG